MVRSYLLALVMSLRRARWDMFVPVNDGVTLKSDLASMRAKVA
jgi:hypothetical protein